MAFSLMWMMLTQQLASSDHLPSRIKLVQGATDFRGSNSILLEAGLEHVSLVFNASNLGEHLVSGR